MSNNVEVAIKIRPLLQIEKDENLQVQWVVNNYSVARAEPQNTKRKHSNVDKFYFDHVFNERSTNHEVFKKVLRKMISLFLCGYNQNVITYGEQNSGKTYMMVDAENDWGIISLAVKYMFQKAAQLANQEFSFKVSCFEVYNDTINDLIDTNNTDLKLMESLSDVVKVVGCKEELVTDADSLLSILKLCEENRKVYDSDVCKRNDKSHVVIRINTVIKNTKTHNQNDIMECNNRFAQLNIVDLAGRKNVTTNLSKKEEFHINMSLSILNLIMVQLNKSSYVQKNVNYEESKLIHCLKSAFGGNSHTAFLCTISPVAIKETLTTLWFASRAAKVENTLKLNVIHCFGVKVLRKIDNFHTLILNTATNYHQAITSEVIQNKVFEAIKDKIYEIGDITQPLSYDQATLIATIVCKCYLDKISLNHTLPFVKHSEIMPAFCTFKEDFSKLQENIVKLSNCTRNGNGCDLINLFQNVEYDIQNLKPRVQLMQTFLKIFYKD